MSEEVFYVPCRFVFMGVSCALLENHRGKHCPKGRLANIRNLTGFTGEEINELGGVNGE